MTESCANCGAEIPEGAQVCDNCGMPVSAAGSPREEPPRRPPTTPPPASRETPAREAASHEAAQETLREPESPAPPPPPPVPTEEQRPVSTPRRRIPLVLGAVLLVLLGVGVAGWLLVMGEEEEAGSDFSVVSDGALSAEFPPDWGTATGADSEAGQTSWSSFLDGDVGASITAAPDVKGWGASVTVGSYMVASKALAEDYTNKDLVVSGPNDMSEACTREDARDFERGSYQVRVQTWSRCRGEPNLNFYTVAAAPEDRECVVVMKLGGFGEAERRLGQNVIDTFEVDCGALPA